jgi:hypothetical protein
MGAIWTKTEDGWKSTIPYGRSTAGWAKAIKGYRKTAATVWTDLFTTDFTPPAAPTITSITVTADLKVNQGRLSITIKAPTTSDVVRVRVKVGKTVSTNNTTDSNYVAAVDGTGQEWSEWDMVPNSTKTKTWPLSGNLTNGATYYVTAWAVDRTRNYSKAVSSSIKYATPKAITVKDISATIVPTDSRSIQKSNNYWVTGDKFLRTGGPTNWHGLWFYSTRLPTTLKGALGIVSLNLQIQRYPNGLVGKTRFHLFSHKMENQSNVSVWSPNQVVNTEGTWHEIEQNQTISVPIPATWYPYILNGTVKGFGIYATTSVANDQYSQTIYGFGTYSGRLSAVYRK